MQLLKDHAKDAILNHLAIQHEYQPRACQYHELKQHKQYPLSKYPLRHFILQMKHQSEVNKIGETLMHMS